MTEHLRDRILARNDLYASNYGAAVFQDIQRSQWDEHEDFRELCKNAMIMGGMRYGALGDPDKDRYDHIASAEHRLKEYMRTGNKTLLVDIANLMLCEWVEENHPNAHIEHQDDGYHSPKIG